jgi:HlyD family secretion protein
MTTGKLVRRGVWLGIVALVVAGAAWFAWPQPIPVDLATVERGPMAVTVDDEARTRVRHVYTVSAPVAGKVLRSPRHVGDEVIADETIVAVIEPVEPSLLDVRSREEFTAALSASEAAVTLAEHEVERATAALAFAESERERAEALAGSAVIAEAALDRARVEVETQAHALASAKAQLDVRRGERASLAARLAVPGETVGPTQSAWSVELLAPASGRILRIVQESEAVVPAGTPLIEIGDPIDLEIVADLLSTDAVQVDVDSPVVIDGWGGPPISGRVERVDPSGFVKVSALGIEEQRVRTIVDLIDPQEAWSRLGHDFRVIVHVTVWSADDAVTVPVSALFRAGEDWAVFRVESGRARMTPVEVGRRNERQAEIHSGLSSGDEVVLHPSDGISDGSEVAER